MADLIGGDTVRMAVKVDDGVIIVSTEEDLERTGITRFYDVRDLLDSDAAWLTKTRPAEQFTGSPSSISWANPPTASGDWHVVYVRTAATTCARAPSAARSAARRSTLNA